MGFEDEQDPSIKFRGFMNQEDEELLTLQRFSIVCKWRWRTTLKKLLHVTFVKRFFNGEDDEQEQ